MADSTIWTNLPRNRHTLLFFLKEVETGLLVNYPGLQTGNLPE